MKKRINFQKLNSSFFLIGILASVLLELINSVVFHYNFSQTGLILGISLLAVLVCFYRFNNGIIAILRGRFGKPRKSDTKFVDYDAVKYKDEIKSEIGDTLLVYKLNSRDSYQIIKQSDRLLIRKCFISNDINECVYEGDLSNADSIKFARGDISIRYDSITKITYKISPTNYYLPIIEIRLNKKAYRFIGLLEELKLDEIKEFFADVVKVKESKEQRDKLSQKLKVEKTAFMFRVLNLVACLCVPNVLFSPFNEGKGIGHALAAAYTIISIVVLALYILLPIIKPSRFGFETDEGTISANQSDTLLGLMLVNLVFLISIVDRQTVLNIEWYIVLIAILSIILSYLFIKKSGFSIKTEGKFANLLGVACAILIVTITCTSIVSGINYTIPLKSYSQVYTIEDRWESTSSKGGTTYYATVRLDGKQRDVVISSDTYESNTNRIQLIRTRGILGIEYVAEEY